MNNHIVGLIAGLILAKDVMRKNEHRYDAIARIEKLIDAYTNELERMAENHE